jgi:hypothetical protein
MNKAFFDFGRLGWNQFLAGDQLAVSQLRQRSKVMAIMSSTNPPRDYILTILGGMSGNDV